MGIDINLYSLEKEKLLNDLETWGAKDKDLTIKILESCGSFVGDQYIILNNECCDGNNPYYSVATLLDSAFHLENSFDCFLNERKEGINYVEKEEIAENLGFNLKEED